MFVLILQNDISLLAVNSEILEVLYFPILIAEYYIQIRLIDDNNIDCLQVLLWIQVQVNCIEYTIWKKSNMPYNFSKYQLLYEQLELQRHHVLFMNKLLNNVFNQLTSSINFNFTYRHIFVQCSFSDEHVSCSFIYGTQILFYCS